MFINSKKMLKLVYFVVCLILIADCIIVTINRKKKSYWYQREVHNIFDFKEVDKEITYETIEFVPPKCGTCWYKTILKEIKNFPILEEIYLDQCENEIVPTLSNLPKLKVFSAMNNNISSLKARSLANVSISQLILSSNNISSIEDSTFGNNLERLHMVCNKLTTINAKWFKNPRKLKELSLTANQIRNIPEKVFKYFVNLETILLRNNEIKTIGNEAFVGPKIIRDLTLSYNQLEEIKPSVFDKKIKTKINSLDIQFNKLTFLHSDLLNRLDIDYFEFWGNPWQCPCRDEIYKWFRENAKNSNVGLPRDGDPGCVFAQSFSDVCIYHVDKELVEVYYKEFEQESIDICKLFREN